jgi:hypothetical protein
MIPWGRNLNRIMASVKYPEMPGTTLIFASDSGGTDPRSRYRVDAFLCLDWDASVEWEVARREIRRSLLADGRRMAYKGLGDAVRGRALVPFLAAALDIRGVLVAAIVNKRIRNLGIGYEHHAELKKRAQLKARWKDPELDTAVRFTHFLACIIAGLARPDQRVYWISDEDNLLGSQLQREDISRLLSSFSSYYMPEHRGQLGMGTTELDEGDRWEEDIAAVADLTAGGLAEVMNRVSDTCGGRLPANLTVEHHDPLLAKAELIAEWFWTAPGRLSRVAIVYEETPQGSYVSFKQDMHHAG